jgi:hypothetical protein
MPSNEKSKSESEKVKIKTISAKKPRKDPQKKPGISLQLILFQ